MDSYIKQGDCLDIMPNIPSGSIDLILCDLPYETTQCNWDISLPIKPLWEQYKRLVKPNGIVVLFGCEPFASKIRLSNLEWYKYDWIWDKIRSTNFLNVQRQPLRGHENIMVFYDSPGTYNPIKTKGHERKVSNRTEGFKTDVYGKVKWSVPYDSTERYPRSVLRISADTQTSAIHPTQKPVALCEYLIRTYSNKGDIVLDNCMGSGTTCIAADNLDRRYIGIEKDPDMFEKAKARIEKNKEQGKQVELEI